MIETTRVERFLYQTLSADPTIAAAVGTRIYAEVPPDNAALPCVRFDLRGARSIYGIGPARIMVDATYLVRFIAEVDSFIGDPEDVADAIDAALHGAKDVSVGGATMLFCIREDPFSLVETPGGAQIRHLGGTYRAWVQ